MAALALGTLVSLLLIGTLTADNYVFETKDFQDRTIIPTLSNGHLGFVAYGESIHMNGLYNGKTGESHRARIPNYGRIQYEYCGVFTSGGDDCTYTLDMRQGLFRTTSNNQNGDVSIQMETYPHRFYEKTIVNHLTVHRNMIGIGGDIFVRLFSGPGTNSVDLEIVHEETENEPVQHTTYILRTLESEDLKYQPELRDFTVIRQDVPEVAILRQGENELFLTWITTIGYDYTDTWSEFEAALALGNTILSSHVQQWTDYWATYDIEAVGDDELAKAIHSSLFFLGSALPSLQTYRPKPFFYGLAPSGLGKGGAIGIEYQGHSFWDTELWMFPPILLLEPEWSKMVLYYRYLVRNAAADSAFNTGYKGLRFPWESGYTGREVTPDCCPQNPMFQQHITADIAFAVKSHFVATHDINWFRTVGCALSYGTAEFWESRVQFNENSKLYDIIGIMGPDEDHYFGSNNAFTNVMAAYNLFFGEFAACICSELEPTMYTRKDHWSKIAKSIKLGYDEENDFIPQFDGFTSGSTSIKQADTVLLSYPLMYPMKETTQRNNLYIYGNATRENGPAMTWAMHAIAHMDIGEVPNEALFKRTYEPYIRKPFYIWSETFEGEVGVGNFITGAGGFLQLIMNGYGGVRLYDDRLEIKNAQLPPGVSNLNIKRISYLDGRFSLDISAVSVVLTVRTLDSNIQVYENDIPMDSTTIYTVPLTSTIVLRPKTNAFGQCRIALSTINEPSSGTSLVFSFMTLIITASMGALYSHI